MATAVGNELEGGAAGWWWPTGCVLQVSFNDAVSCYCCMASGTRNMYDTLRFYTDSNSQKPKHYKKHVRLPIRSPNILYDRAWVRTRPSATRGRLLTE